VIKVLLFGTKGCSKCEKQKEIFKHRLHDVLWEYIDVNDGGDETDVKLAYYEVSTELPYIVIENEDADILFSYSGMLAPRKLAEVLKNV